MKLSEVLAACDGRESVELLIDRRLVAGGRAKLMPSGRRIGTIVGISRRHVLARFSTADVREELATAIALEEACR